MTLRCERAKSNGAPFVLPLWLALLAGAGICLIPPVAAQDEGSQLPPPPKVKHHQQEAPDADFPSPLKRDTIQSDGNDQGGNGQGGFNSQRPGGHGAGWPQRPGLQGSAEGGQPGGGGGQFGLRRRPGRFAGGTQEFDGQSGGLQFGFGGPGGAIFGGQGRAGLAAGGARGHMQMGIPGARRPLDLTPLNLSEEQKQHIRGIRKGTRQEIRSARQTLVQRQLQLRSMLFSADANDADIRNARKQLRAAQNRVDDLGLDDLLQIRGILTAEQRQKLPNLAPPVAQSGAFGPSGGPAISSQKN